MADRKCRWGILGAATIARKNWDALRRAGNAELIAVASRSAERARQFINECQSVAPQSRCPEAVEGYEALLAREDIDAVYIPLPTGIRAEWVIKAAEAGKHVVCEKPCGANAGQVRDMVAACDANGVQFMDGVMFMHSRRLEALRQVLDDGVSIGDVKRITAQFSFCAPDEFKTGNIRTHAALEPLGCLGDLGWYTIRFALWTMGYRPPREVSGRLLATLQRPDSPDAVPMEFSGELFFDGGVSASYYVSFLTEHQQWANVSGTRGYLHVRDFVLPFYGPEVAFEVSNSVFTIDGCDFNMEDHTRRVAVPEYSNNASNAQEVNLFRRFSEIVLSGQRDSHWPQIALLTQQVMDACLQSARNGGATLPFSAE